MSLEQKRQHSHQVPRGGPATIPVLVQHAQSRRSRYRRFSLSAVVRAAYSTRAVSAPSAAVTTTRPPIPCRRPIVEFEIDREDQLAAEEASNSPGAIYSRFLCEAFSVGPPPMECRTGLAGVAF